MKLLYSKSIKKCLKPLLSATKQISKYTRSNHLSLLNLFISILILYKLDLIQTSLAELHEKLLKTYIDILQAVGFDVMLLMQVIQKLFGGEGA